MFCQDLEPALVLEDNDGCSHTSQGRVDRRLEEVAEAVGGGLLSVTNAIEHGTWRQWDSGWA